MMLILVKYIFRARSVKHWMKHQEQRETGRRRTLDLRELESLDGVVGEKSLEKFERILLHSLWRDRHKERGKV